MDDLAPDDFRRTNPRFMGENFQKNLDLVEAVKAIAADKGVTAASWPWPGSWLRGTI